MSQDVGWTPSGNSYECLEGGEISSGTNGTEGNVECPTPVALTLKNMAIYISGTGGSGNGTVRTRKNGTTNGNLTCNYTSATLGLVEDTTHSDTVISTDKWNFQLIKGSTTPTFIFWGLEEQQYTTPTAGKAFNTNAHRLMAAELI